MNHLLILSFSIIALSSVVVNATPLTTTEDKAMIDALIEAENSPHKKPMVMVIDVDNFQFESIMLPDGSNFFENMQMFIGEAKYRGIQTIFVEFEGSPTIDSLTSLYSDPKKFTKNEFNAMSNESLRLKIIKEGYTDIFIMGHEGNTCINCTIAGGNPVGPLYSSDAKFENGYNYGLLNTESINVHISPNTTATARYGASSLENAYIGDLYINPHPRLHVYDKLGDITPEALQQMMDDC